MLQKGINRRERERPVFYSYGINPMSIPAHHILTLLRRTTNHGNHHLISHLHCHTIKVGLRHSPPFPVTLLNGYSKTDNLKSSCQMFDETLQRDPILWSVLLSAHVRFNLPGVALSLVRPMIEIDGVKPDGHIFATLVKACSELGDARIGTQVHGKVLCSEFFDDDVVKSALVDMYSKCGLIWDARKVFDSLIVRNNISWTAMVSGYACNGFQDEALVLFQRMPGKELVTWTAIVAGFARSGDGVGAVRLFLEMRREGVGIHDSFVLSSVIGASANMATLEVGRQLHCVVIVLGYKTSLITANALVDMYAKCSDIVTARAVFQRIASRDTISWTTMIVGEAQHGQPKDALSLFNTMVKERARPNEVTFVGLLYACSHAGLVQRGRQIFNSMLNDYGIIPSLQHYTCMLDLLGRSGLLSEAEDFIRSMPVQPDEAMWAALLSSCKKFGDINRSLRLADDLLSLKPQSPSTYVLLSNTYAQTGRWDSVAKIRTLLTGMELRKEPGYSWVEAGKESYTFTAGEVPPQMQDELLGLLNKLNAELKKRGYVPETSTVMHDVEEQEKEQQLSLHSERLAVAFGLLKGVEGTTIRVVKNLRICLDCHNFMKMVSRVCSRNIVVRDANRFHNFTNGVCSCGDFW